MEEFCRILPKVELHAHLNGSLSKATLENLGCGEASVAEYQQLSHLYEKSERTLDECFELFSVAHKATSNKSSVYSATASVINEFREDNCIYLELRTTPRTEPGMTKREYVEAVVQAILDHSNGIIVKLLLSIDRTHGTPTSLGTVELFKEMRMKYPGVMAGLDLCGNPNQGCFPLEVFVEARKMGIPITLHCAEVVIDAEVFEMLQFKPNRIGHATFIHPSYGGSSECWKLFLKNPIPIECCLTSNVVCRTVNGFKNHHLNEWIKNELPFTLSTDDKGVFCTTLSKEYDLAQEHFHLTKDELWKISYNSIDYCFATGTEKDQLKSILIDFYKHGL